MNKKVYVLGRHIPGKDELIQTLLRESKMDVVLNENLDSSADFSDAKIVFWFDGDLPPLRETRKDLFLVGLHTADRHMSPEEQYTEALTFLKKKSANLILSVSYLDGLQMVVCPEESAYHIHDTRSPERRHPVEARTAIGLAQMALLRSHLTFTRSTVVAGDPVPWESPLVPQTLREIVDRCIAQGAYRRVNGVTAGHFAVRLDDTTFLTSRRKTDFNDMKTVGLVKVRTDSPDTVLAYGAKPSVGGQSQRIVFAEHEGYDCILHFHCPKCQSSDVPVRSQREFECGSHQCGKNTSDGLKPYTVSDGTTIKAVYLDNHGPNILFNSASRADALEAFILQHFDLTQKTGGFQLAAV